jgi:hypothetical protein
MRRSVSVMVLALALVGFAQPSGAWGYGGWYGHGWYGHGGHSSVVIGLGVPLAPFAPYYGYGYPYPYGYGYAYPYPVPYAYSPPAAVQSGPVQMQQQDQSYWYYCQDPQGYYPYIRQCPSGWMQVVPPQGPPS